MLSHDNLTYAALTNTEFFKWQFGEEIVLSYLPQNHVGGIIMDFANIMCRGGVCCFADKNALKGTLLENLQYYKPTRFLGVTRVFEKIEEGIKSKGADTKGVKKLFVEWAKKQALNHHKQEELGKSHSSFGYNLAKKFVFSKVHDGLGFTNTENFIIGAAAVSPETVRFFLSLDMKLLEAIREGF